MSLDYNESRRRYLFTQGSRWRRFLRWIARVAR